jgi:hypothetical protein
MLIETTEVSAKTPRDGKLELSAESATRLATLGSDFELIAPGGAGRARLMDMLCTCAKRAGAAHSHHFLESPLFTSLVPGAHIRIELTDGGALYVLNAPP